MRTKVMTLSLLAIAGMAQAQWSTSGSDIYKNPNPSGNVGIGTTAPVKPLDVRGRSTFGGGKIESDFQWTPNSNEQTLILTGDATGGYGSMLVGSNDVAASGQWLGTLFFGQNVSDSTFGNSNAGLKAFISGLSSGLGGHNSGYGGNILFNTKADNAPVNLPVERMRITMDGDVGIGMTTPLARLDVQNDVTNTATNEWGIRGSINQVVSSVSGSQFFTGVEGQANTSFPGQAILRGMHGTATNGLFNTGGLFQAVGGSGGDNYGVYASASGNNLANYGIFAYASGGSVINWAGYFAGNIYCTGTYQGSDRNLKNDIKPFTDGMDKIMQLKPSTYTFKTNEFKNMNLPAGNQIGLIAQDLELVFPELVKDTPENTEVDKNGVKTVLNPAFKSVQYTGLIPVLIAGIQEQQAHITQQDQDIADLKNELAALKNNGTTGINQLSPDANGFAMLQNEPNPFSTETVVKYTLPQTVTNASLYVYDLTGKQITNFPITQKGSSAITITSDKLSAGIYIYSIVADGVVVDSKRMIVAGK